MASVTEWVSVSALTLIATAAGINVARGTFRPWVRAKFLLTAATPSVVVITNNPGQGLTPVTPISPANINPDSSRRYSDPLPGGRLISAFGVCRTGLTCTGPCCRRHKGIDIAAPTGTPVLAVATGRVAAAGSVGSGGCGLRVRVNNSDGSKALYCHLSSVMVSTGNATTAGVPVGRVGNTGNATNTTPHLHFELHIAGRAVDPTRLVGR